MFESYAESILNENLFGGGGSNIKSIQYGRTQINVYGTETITMGAIDTDKAILEFSYHGDRPNPANHTIRGEFIDSTTIKFTGVGSFGSVDLMWRVVEFNNVKSKQTGDYTISALGDCIIAIASIDKEKSMTFFSYTHPSTTNTDIQVMRCLADIDNVYDDRFIVRQYATGAVVHWEIIEFN